MLDELQPTYHSEDGRQIEYPNISKYILINIAFHLLTAPRGHNLRRALTTKGTPQRHDRETERATDGVRQHRPPQPPPPADDCRGEGGGGGGGEQHVRDPPHEQSQGERRLK
ncbi:hypothetical protein CDAR_4611 [Caerostris darwini]|uniref:Uncharacterized protein n=1 Tax=Caerostris darwini TaxID=1538125 RepID=A0AAV4MQC1_9ARAC|nr:hypothetical protein CDAR_4611 [Caerostris darwini]